MIFRNINCKISYLLGLCILLTCNYVNAEFKLRILHANDIESRFLQTDEHGSKCSKNEENSHKCYGGFARLKQAAKIYTSEAKSHGRHVLFLNAGNTYYGSMYFNLFRWKIVAEMTEMLGFDAMSLGKNEFIDGPEGLAPFINKVSFPILGCNLDVSKVPSLNTPNLKKSKIFTLGNNIKVGVVGYITDLTKGVSYPKNVEVLDVISSLQKEVELLRRKGVNIIIALGNSGFIKDKEIAKHVRGVDLVVGGNSKTFLYNGESPSTEEIDGHYPTMVTQDGGRKIPVVQAYAHTKYLGVLDLNFDAGGKLKSCNGNPVLLDNSIPQDKEVLAALKPWVEEFEEKIHEKITISKVLLEGSKEKIQRQETNFGNLIADAYIDAYVRKYNGPGWTDAPIALVQSGGVKQSIDVTSAGGVVTLGDLLAAFPYHNELCRIEVKGKQLLQALEFNVEKYGKEDNQHEGAFLQVSGLRINYDITAPPGNRVSKVLVRCGNCPVPNYKELDPEKTYGIIASEYTTIGGNGFEMFKNHYTSITKIGTNIFTAVKQFLKAYSPVYPEIDARIKINKH